LSKPVAEYLCDLKAKLEAVADFTEQHAKHAQDKYAVHYNLLARIKSFMEGNQVVVLAPEGEGKMSSRWKGPGTVVKVKSPHSYLTDMGNGNIKHSHGSKIRKIVSHIQCCGVISDKDSEFGRVLLSEHDVSDNSLPSNRIDGQKLEHLNSPQRDQLLQLLDEFADCFIDRPGPCDVETHPIITSSDIVRK